MTTLYFPITIKSSRKFIKLGESISLARIDNARYKRIVGINKIVLSGGTVVEVGYEEKAPWFIWATYLRQNHPTHDLLLFQTNFLLAVSSREQAIIVGFAMKLISGTKSGPFIGFSDKKTSGFSTHHLNCFPYWGGDLLNLERAEIKLLKVLVGKLEQSHQDKRLGVMIEKFRYAESYGLPSKSLRFLELSVILEMLFLPKKDPELSYRFRLRVAKWFSRHYGEDTRVMFDQAKKIYNIRSTIAHAGTAEVTDQDMNVIRDIARRALRKYICDRSLFQEQYLDELCLIG